MADKSQMTSQGGQYYASVAASAAGNSLINSVGGQVSGPGRLCKLVTLTNDTAVLTLYDNTTGPGGNILFNTVVNTATATIYNLDIPVANGIWAKGAANTPAVGISFTLDTPYGR